MSALIRPVIARSVHRISTAAAGPAMGAVAAVSASSPIAGPSRLRSLALLATPPPTTPSQAQEHRRHPSISHSTRALRFDAQSLDASAGDEGARVGAILTASKQPAEPADEGVWRGGGEPTIVLTRRAVERLQIIAAAEAKEKASVGQLALRLAVEPGGCHGYQYKIELTEEPEEDDFHFQAPPSRSSSSSATQGEPLPVLIDSVSLALLKGATIDYVTELIGSQFAIRDNPQAKGSGCGCGVSWEPAI